MYAQLSPVKISFYNKLYNYEGPNISANFTRKTKLLSLTYFTENNLKPISFRQVPKTWDFFYTTHLTNLVLII